MNRTEAISQSHQHSMLNDRLISNYEMMFNEKWLTLEARVRSNPNHKIIIDMIDDEEWEEIEKIRLSQLPWWKKLLGIKT